MSNAKLDLVRDFNIDLISMLGDEIARTVSDALTVRLADYELQHACKELSIPETQSEVMLRDYLATLKIEGRAMTTIRRYNDRIRKMMAFCQKPTVDIDTYDLRRYLAQMSLNGLKASTIEGERSIMASFFSWLHNEGLIKSNPASRLNPIHEGHVVRPPFSNTDIDKLRDACESTRDRALLEVLRSTGARISEVTALNRNQINWNTLEVVVTGKGNKQRVAYLDDVAAMHLRSYLDSRKDRSPALFEGWHTERMTRSGVSRMLNRLGERAGVENVHPHRFRRTLATNLAKRGMPVQDISRILGHSEVDTTMIYITMDDTLTKSNYKKYTA